ncbi:HAD-IA family hydrolase [Kaistia sp. MMO-174]|uniref:HAD-IA family hydrolase n=1 Tax=Kaistia sp. MMO-174 TaxID=3081256 RepID=UPI001ACE09A2|nr:HAD-IA family hydrolase [Rhodospirillales bacterium]
MTTDALFGGRSFAAFLFDMDGTLLTSIEAAERVWSDWARRQGLDVEAFLPTLHGKRAIDTVRQLGLPGIDVEAEAEAILQAEIDDVDGVREIGGAAGFLSALPPDRWAVVTSAPRLLAIRRLEAAGLTPPAVFVTADDVTIGKPEPDCYLLAASRLGVAASDCLVFEDAPAGIEAGERAGASVLVIQATHTAPAATVHPGVGSYDGLRVATDTEGRLILEREAG